MTLLPAPSSTAVCKELEEGAVVFCTRTEVYFGLNSVGRIIWDSLPPAARTFDELEKILVSRFPDVDKEILIADANEFLAQLAEAGLVIPAESGSSAN